MAKGHKKPDKQVTVTRKVVREDIRRTTRTTKRTVKPPDPPPAVPAEPGADGPPATPRAIDTTGLTFRRDVPPEFVAPPDLPGLGEPRRYGMQMCIASARNGYGWVARPCIRVERGSIYFNDKACLAFGLTDGMAMIPAVTDNNTLIAIRCVASLFPRRAHLHRSGCFRLEVRYERFQVRPRDGVFPHALYGRIRRRGKGGLSIAAENPGLIGRIFPVLVNPHDPDELVAIVADDYNPDTLSVHGKLSLRGCAGDLATAFPVAAAPKLGPDSN